MRKDTLLVRTTPKKALAGLALGLALSVAGAAHGAPTFYGFEDGLTGDWTSPITNVASGGGVLGVASAGGVRHAELTNVPNSYSAGYGFGNYSVFGHLPGPSPFAGGVSQSIAVYIDTTLNSGGTPGINDAFWIDMAPRNTNTTFSDSNGEHNFRVATDGTQAFVSFDGPVVMATLTMSGWYNFEITYEQGGGGNVISDAFVKSLGGTVLGSVLDVESPNGSMPNADLGAEGYVWITAWLNGYSGDTLAIDNVQAVPEPATLALLGLGLAGLGFGRRKRA